LLSISTENDGLPLPEIDTIHNNLNSKGRRASSVAGNQRWSTSFIKVRKSLPKISRIDKRTIDTRIKSNAYSTKLCPPRPGEDLNMDMCATLLLRCDQIPNHRCAPLSRRSSRPLILTDIGKKRNSFPVREVRQDQMQTPDVCGCSASQDRVGPGSISNFERRNSSLKPKSRSQEKPIAPTSGSAPP